MLSWAVPMNCRSVAEHVWMTAARPFPPTRRTSEPMTKIATASPAAAVKRGFTPLVSAAPRGMLHHPFGCVSSVEPKRPRGPRDPARQPEAERQQEAAEVTHPPLRVALVSRGWIDPHLLHLYRGGRPGGCLGLEEDRVALDPDPRAALFDL